MLVALKTFQHDGITVERGQQVKIADPRLTKRLLNTRHVRAIEAKQPMQLVVTNRPERDGRRGFEWFGVWYGPGDVVPEDNMVPNKRRILLSIDWVREEPIPEKKPAPRRRKKTTAKRAKPARRKKTKRVAA